MKDERILLFDGEKEHVCRADQIIIPNIRPYGLLLTNDEQMVLEYAFRSVTRIHNSILLRNDILRKEDWRIDVPDLSFISKQFHPRVQREFRDLEVIFKSLVRHFLPNAARTQNYSYNGKHVHGVRYRGYAWVSDEVFQVE